MLRSETYIEIECLEDFRIGLRASGSSPDWDKIIDVDHRGFDLVHDGEIFATIYRGKEDRIRVSHQDDTGKTSEASGLRLRIILDGT